MKYYTSLLNRLRKILTPPQNKGGKRIGLFSINSRQNFLLNNTVRTSLFIIAALFFIAAYFQYFNKLARENARVAKKYAILKRIRNGERVKSHCLSELEEAGLIVRDGDKYKTLFEWDGKRLVE